MSHLDADSVRSTLEDVANAIGHRFDDDVEIHDQTYAASWRQWAEPWSQWRYWSQGMDLLLRLIAACYDPDRELRNVDWDLLDRWWARHTDHHGYVLPASYDDRTKTPSPTTAKSIAAFLVRRWMQWGNVSYALRWNDNDESPRLVLEADSLFGALAAEAAATAVGSPDVEFCTNCGRPFQRSGDGRRRTQRSKNPYCDIPACRRAISRDSKRRRRSNH